MVIGRREGLRRDELSCGVAFVYAQVLMPPLYPLDAFTPICQFVLAVLIPCPIMCATTSCTCRVAHLQQVQPQHARAGQAIIQFAKRLHSREEFALKFFLHRTDYEAEAASYRSAHLGSFMPAVERYVDNDDGMLRDAAGNPMPPCIIMERGESLRDRMMLAHTDKAGTAQVRCPPTEPGDPSYMAASLKFIRSIVRVSVAGVCKWTRGSWTLRLVLYLPSTSADLPPPAPVWPHCTITERTKLGFTLHTSH